MGLSRIIQGLILPIALSGCITVNIPVYSNLNRLARSDYSDGCRPSKQSMESHVSELWNSGLLQDSDAVKSSVLGKNYGVAPDVKFSDGNRWGEYMPLCTEDMSVCYQTIFLNERLFCEELPEEDFYGKAPTLERVLSHNLFFSFWFEPFLDDGSRASFRTAAKQIYLNSGDSSYAAFVDYCKDGSECKDIFGADSFAFFGERACADGAGIPGRIRAFYEDMLTDKALDGLER